MGSSGRQCYRDDSAMRAPAVDSPVLAPMDQRDSDLDVRRLETGEEAEWCARTMAASEPWRTLERGYEESLALVRDAARETWVARRAGALVGFAVLQMKGAFVGYVQTVCVAPEVRGAGIGSRLLAFVERRIFRESPNVFLCVSSFNGDARRLYDRLGYEPVGELRDYIVPGHSELLLRKTIGPLRGFRAQGQEGD
jgi:predicted GNAT family acetyltransferase